MNGRRRLLVATAAALLLLGLAFLILRGWGAPAPAPPAPDPMGRGGTPVGAHASPPDHGDGEVPDEASATAMGHPGEPEESSDPDEDPGPTVRILVTGPDDRPVAEASVLLERVRENEDDWEPTDDVFGETGADGAVEIEIPTPADRLRLVVEPPEDGVLLTGIVDPWDGKLTTIRLREALRLIGRVVDPDGAPLPGAQVFLTVGESGDEFDTYSDVKGDFVFGGLHPGEVELAVSLGTRPTGVRRLVRAGDRDVLLVVRSGGTAVVRVEGIEHPGHMGVIVVFEEESGEWLRSWSAPDSEGRLFLPGLHPERTYTIWAGPFAGRHLFRRGLRPGTETTVPVAKGAELRGRVAWPESRPPHHVQVYIKDRGLWTATTIGRGGVFHFPSVPPGAWKVEVFAMDNQGKLTGSEVIETGEPGVVHIR